MWAYFAARLYAVRVPHLDGFADAEAKVTLLGALPPATPVQIHHWAGESFYSRSMPSRSTLCGPHLIPGRSGCCAPRCFRIVGRIDISYLGRSICPVHDALRCSRRSRSHVLDVFDEALDQIGRILNERLGEDLQLVPVLVEPVPVDTVMAQHHRLEEALFVVGQAQDTNAKRNVVKNIDPSEIVILDRAKVLPNFSRDEPFAISASVNFSFARSSS